MADTSLVEVPPQTNGISDDMDEEERAKMRPADIDADVKEMERRKRVELIMNSKLFREELERIIEVQLRDGSGTSGLMQQISDMMGVSKNSGNVFKNSNCVVPINDIRGIEAMGYAKGEKILRCKLAAVYRLIDLYGWTQGTSTLITARLNQDEEHFLVNPYGMLFHEITASSLIKADMQGNVVEQGTTNFAVNLSAYSLHAAIHSSRPDIKCIIHVHTPSVVAVSALKCGLLPISQESVVIGEVSTHPYIGGVNDPEEKDKITRNLGPNNKVLLLTNQGAVCCGETIEEAFFNARNTVLASESQLKLMPIGIDNLILLNDETRKKLYEAAHKAPESSPRPDQPSILETKIERKWRVGGVEFEALMRMLDNAGFRTGYIYRHPLVKGDPPRPRNDVEVPPAVSSLGYLIEEEELYKQGLWKKLEGGRKGHDRTRWLNSPNVYQKVEILETGTPDPKKITKWVADGSPTHSSTPVKIEHALQFVPKNTNPKEFKKLQQQIKDYRRADKISAGPQSHILEGVTWEEARKMQDAGVTQTGDQVVLMGAASKGIIQRGFQHNATMYKSPYAKNPFDSITDEEIDEYKKVVEKKTKGEYDTDFSESEGLSSAQINKRISDIRSPTSAASETEEESRDEPQVLRIETKQAPKPSQPEVVLSDDVTSRRLPPVDRKSATNSMRRRGVHELGEFYRTNSYAGFPKGSYALPNPKHYHIARCTTTTQHLRPVLVTFAKSNSTNENIGGAPKITIDMGDGRSVTVDVSMQTLKSFIQPFVPGLNLLDESVANASSQTCYLNVEKECSNNISSLLMGSFEREIMQKLQENLVVDLIKSNLEYENSSGAFEYELQNCEDEGAEDTCNFSVQSGQSMEVPDLPYACSSDSSVEDDPRQVGSNCNALHSSGSEGHRNSMETFWREFEEEFVEIKKSASRSFNSSEYTGREGSSDDNCHREFGTKDKLTFVSENEVKDQGEHSAIEDAQGNLTNSAKNQPLTQKTVEGRRIGQRTAAIKTCVSKVAGAGIAKKGSDKIRKTSAKKTRGLARVAKCSKEHFVNIRKTALEVSAATVAKKDVENQKPVDDPVEVGTARFVKNCRKNSRRSRQKKTSKVGAETDQVSSTTKTSDGDAVVTAQSGNGDVRSEDISEVRNPLPEFEKTVEANAGVNEVTTADEDHAGDAIEIREPLPAFDANFVEKARQEDFPGENIRGTKRSNSDVRSEFFADLTAAEVTETHAVSDDVERSEVAIAHFPNCEHETAATLENAKVPQIQLGNVKRNLFPTDSGLFYYGANSTRGKNDVNSSGNPKYGEDVWIGGNIAFVTPQSVTRVTQAEFEMFAGFSNQEEFATQTADDFTGTAWTFPGTGSTGAASANWVGNPVVQSFQFMPNVVYGSFPAHENSTVQNLTSPETVDYLDAIRALADAVANRESVDVIAGNIVHSSLEGKSDHFSLEDDFNAANTSHSVGIASETAGNSWQSERMASNANHHSANTSIRVISSVDHVETLSSPDSGEHANFFDATGFGEDTVIQRSHSVRNLVNRYETQNALGAESDHEAGGHVIENPLNRKPNEPSGSHYKIGGRVLSNVYGFETCYRPEFVGNNPASFSGYEMRIPTRSSDDRNISFNTANDSFEDYEFIRGNPVLREILHEGDDDQLVMPNLDVLGRNLRRFEEEHSGSLVRLTVKVHEENLDDGKRAVELRVTENLVSGEETVRERFDIRANCVLEDSVTLGSDGYVKSEENFHMEDVELKITELAPTRYPKQMFEVVPVETTEPLETTENEPTNSNVTSYNTVRSTQFGLPTVPAFEFIQSPKIVTKTTKFDETIVVATTNSIQTVPMISSTQSVLPMIPISGGLMQSPKTIVSKATKLDDVTVSVADCTTTKSIVENAMARKLDDSVELATSKQATKSNKTTKSGKISPSTVPAKGKLNKGVQQVSGDITKSYKKPEQATGKPKKNFRQETKHVETLLQPTKSKDFPNVPATSKRSQIVDQSTKTPGESGHGTAATGIVVPMERNVEKTHDPAEKRGVEPSPNEVEKISAKVAENTNETRNKKSHKRRKNRRKHDGGNKLESAGTNKKPVEEKFEVAASDRIEEKIEEEDTGLLKPPSAEVDAISLECVDGCNVLEENVGFPEMREINEEVEDSKFAESRNRNEEISKSPAEATEGENRVNTTFLSDTVKDSMNQTFVCIENTGVDEKTEAMAVLDVQEDISKFVEVCMNQIESNEEISKFVEECGNQIGSNEEMEGEEISQSLNLSKEFSERVDDLDGNESEELGFQAGTEQEMVDLIVAYLVKNCMDIDGTAIFPELKNDENAAVLTRKLSNLYAEYIYNSRTEDTNTVLRLGLHEAVLKALNIQQGNSHEVSDKSFAVTEFLCELLDHVFNMFSESRGKFNDFEGMIHSTPEREKPPNPEELFDEDVISFQVKQLNSGNAYYWLKIVKSPKPNRKTYNVINVDDIPLRPPPDLNATYDKVESRRLSPISESNFSEIPDRIIKSSHFKAPPSGLNATYDKPELPGRLSPILECNLQLNFLEDEILNDDTSETNAQLETANIKLNDRNNMDMIFKTTGDQEGNGGGENLHDIQCGEASNTSNVELRTDTDANMDNTGPKTNSEEETHVSNLQDVTSNDCVDGNDNAYVMIEHPEVNRIVHNEVRFYRSNTITSSSYVQTNNISFNKSNGVEKNGGNVDDNEDAGNWMGYDKAKF